MDPVVWADEPQPADDAPRRGRARWVVVAIAALTGLWFFAGGVAERDVVVVGDRGTTVPAIAEDGTPVHVLRTEDGTVQVFEALAPAFGDDTGVGELVAWCPQVDTFVAGHAGRSFTQEGLPIVGAVPGRIPPRALGTLGTLSVRGVTRLPLEGDRTLPVRVGGPLGPVDSDEVARPDLTSAQASMGPPGACKVPGRPRLGPAPFQLDTGEPEPTDHASLAVPLPEAPEDGWHLAEGVLHVRPDATAVWCDEDVGAGECPDPHPVAVDLPVTAAQVGGAPAALAGPLALRVEEGRVVRAMAMFSTDWRGSSLQGSVRYEATDGELSEQASLLRVVPIDDARPTCTGATRSLPGDRLTREERRRVAQYVDVDTRFADGWDQAARVEVVADLATCRALSVSPSS